jgi:hypothetical protein
MGLIAAPERGDAVTHGPPDHKGLLGEAWPNQVLTENFAVLYTPTVDPAVAELTASLLEEAWTALVEEQGWRGPPRSDAFLVRVELDPSISWTGYTSMVAGDDGDYPLIQLHPSTSGSPPFYASLVAHEFAHALQFGYRPAYNATPDEPWYWEASAEWSAELALPDIDAYAQQVVYYADRPELHYASTQDSHAYGMSVLNAALLERLDVDLLTIWELGEQHPQRTWDEVIAEAAELPAGAVWGEFTGAMGNNLLAESELYADVIELPLEVGASSQLQYLGTHYYRASEASTMLAAGDVMLGGPDGYGDRIELQAGDVLSVTGLDPDVAVYQLQGDVLREPKGCVGCGGGQALWLGLLSPILLATRRSRRRRRSGCSSR